ncbi:MAG TPA: AI-2E family transporter [Candidatus Saccharimonadales bacterium]|nr:AI-2E family transporter [Candidatus Saccharimonadales bacterium]
MPTELKAGIIKPMQPSRQVMVNVTNRTIVRTILWVLAAIVLFKFVGRVSHILTLIFASAFLAMALNPVVEFIKRFLSIKSRTRATAVTYLTVVLLLVGFFALITPPLVRQTRDFIKEVPTIVEDFQQGDSSLAKFVRDNNLDNRLSQGAKDFASQYSDFGSTVLNTGKRVVGAVVSVLAVFVLTFMMLVEGPRWLKAFWRIDPSKNKSRQQKIVHNMYRGVTGFALGQITLAIVGGFFAFVALTIASDITNVSINAVALAGIVAVFALIPMFGTLLSSAIVVLVLLLSSGSLALIMLIYFVVYQQIENHTFQPVVQSRLSRLTPMTVFIAALLGVGFGGILGAIVAIPIASAVKILVEDYLENRNPKIEPKQA